MAYTAKQIAAMIGVSQATLSLVVNNKPGISDTTRRHVVEELKNRGFEYLLNEKSSGSEIVLNNSQVIAFIIYKNEGKLLGYDSFFPLIMDSLENRAHKHQYGITFITVENRNVTEGLERIKASGCCGCVLFATEMKEEDIRPFLSLKLPLVLLDNHFNGLNLNTVEVGNEQGTYIAVRHLIEKGHTKIGYLRSGVRINSFEERYRFARMAMDIFQTETPEEYCFEIGYAAENAYNGMLKLLDSGKPLPTAFLADNDLVAAGAMKACRERGLRVPEEVSFIGFDDRPICFLTEPSMTTIQIPREYFGAEAVEVLIRIVNGETTMHQHIALCGSVVERESVCDLR